MALSSIRKPVISAVILACASTPLLAGSGRIGAVERFGIGGYVQPIGFHHGFHIERITPGSAADRDQLQPHDVIIKVDGEAIRNIDHLRALLAEAYADNGEVLVTYLRGSSLTHHDLHCKLKAKDAPAKVARKPKPKSDDLDDSDDKVARKPKPKSGDKVARKPKVDSDDSDDDIEIK